MSLKSPFKDNSKKEKKAKKLARSVSSNAYELRSNSPKTPNKNMKTVITPCSPSSQKCPTCQNVEKIKNFNLSEAVKEFNDKLEEYKILSKSLLDSTSCLDHAVNAIKHFILKFDTESMNDFLSTSVKDIETVKGNLTDLTNYVTKLDDIEENMHSSTESLSLLAKRHENLSDRFTKVEEIVTKSIDNNEQLLNKIPKLNEIEKFIHNKLEHLESITQDKDHVILQKISSLEQVCNELNQKADNTNHISYNRNPQLEDLEELINTKFNSLQSPLSSDKDNVTIIHRFNKVEEICNTLHSKIDSITNYLPIATSNFTPHVACNIAPNVKHNTTPITPRNVPHIASNYYNATQQNATSTPKADTTPRDCIILGDSNSKYINIDTNHIKTTRIPTYRISDINPQHCIGYSRIWIHVGINDLKTRNCQGPGSVHMYHNLLLQKLHQVRRVCPNSKIIVSPILPTGVPVLNERARLFTNLLYTGPRWFELLDFRAYCGTNGGLLQKYRCYGNTRDRIHLGRIGIDLLKNMLISSISKVDTRSYSTVLQTGQPQNNR